MTIFNQDKKIFGLGPMAGFTDSAFRLLCKEYGADLVYTELISARGIVEDQKFVDKGKSFRLARFDQNEQPILVQIFGGEPGIMAEAAKIIEEKLDPAGIDINMGCPAPKVVKNAGGSALMKNPAQAAEIVKAVKKAVKAPVWVKTRLGWSQDEEILEFAKHLEMAGADGLAVHARTKIQGFSGEPNWEMVGKLKKQLAIPLLANGGIKNWQDAYECLKITNANGILIGQATLGRPWIFEEIKERKLKSKNLEEIIWIAQRHLELFQKTGLDFCEMKKHLLQYFKGFENAARWRERISAVNSLNEFNEIVQAEKMLKG